MRKRVFGSIFLTALITLLLTASLLLIAVHTGLAHDMRSRLANECSYIAAAIQDNDWQELGRIGRIYADRITLVGSDGAVLYDNESDVSAWKTTRRGRRSHRRCKTAWVNPAACRIRFPNRPITMRCAWGMAWCCASPRQQTARWRAFNRLTVDYGDCSAGAAGAALLASWLTHVFLEPIVSLDLHAPLKNDAYDELSPLLHRMDKQNTRSNPS